MGKLYDRIKYISDNEGFNSLNEFAKFGLGHRSSEKLSRLKNESAKPSFDILENIATNFPKYDMNWLITGVGNPSKSNPDTEEGVRDTNFKQLLEFDKLKSNEVKVILNESFLGRNPFISIPYSINCDGAIVNNDIGLAPEINKGDILLYKSLQNFPQEVLFGGLYIVSFIHRNEQIDILRYLGNSEKDKFDFTLFGHEPTYEQPLNFENVVGMKQVKAIFSIKL